MEENLIFGTGFMAFVGKGHDVDDDVTDGRELLDFMTVLDRDQSTTRKSKLLVNEAKVFLPNPSFVNATVVDTPGSNEASWIQTQRTETILKKSTMTWLFLKQNVRSSSSALNTLIKPLLKNVKFDKKSSDILDCPKCFRPQNYLCVVQFERQ